MVLEGLKKAQVLTSLLNRLGFTREDGKPVKAEHYDQEFANKSSAAALNALLSGLESRILTIEEAELFGFLEENGLLTGLVANSDVSNAPSDAKVAISESDLRQCENEIAALNILIDEGDLKERQLEAQIIEQSQLIDRFSMTPLTTPEVLINGSVSDLNNALLALSRFTQQVQQTLQQIIEHSVSNPPSNNDTHHGSMYSTITNNQIIRCGWDNEVESFYLGKIASGIARLQASGLDINEIALMAGERRLNALRVQFLQLIYEGIKDILAQVESIIFLWNSLDSEYCRHWESFEKITNDMQDKLSQYEKVVEAVISRSLHVDPSTPSLLPHNNNPNQSIQLEEIQEKIGHLSSQTSKCQELINRLILPNGEVNIVADVVREKEQMLRDSSKSLSSFLEQTLTISEKLTVINNVHPI